MKNIKEIKESKIIILLDEFEKAKDIDIEEPIIEPELTEEPEHDEPYGNDGCPGDIELDFITCDNCKQEYGMHEEHECSEKWKEPDPEEDPEEPEEEREN